MQIASKIISVGQYIVFPSTAKDKFWICHMSGEGGQFPLPLFEAEVSPLSQLSERDAERVERFYRVHF